WQDEVVCDGKPKQVVARLEKDTGSIPKPPVAPTVLNIQRDDPSTNFAGTQGGQSQQQQTAQQNWQTGEQSVSIESQPKKSVFSPLVLGIIGISGIFLLTLVGVTAAFMLGLIGKTTEPGDSNAIVSGNNTGVQPTPPEQIKAEMVQIPGGKFMMGRNDGADLERPEHEIEVKSFWMDKTEVTNAEFYEFIKDVGFGAPTHWLRGRPVPGEENMPVRYVSFNDAKTFAAWRSKRDGVNYRLPTEEEWEYAARNGGQNNLYPWGDNWDLKRAVVRRTLTFEPVGSKPEGANKWGVVDLIGNVWEWTGSQAKPYPGSDYKFKETKDALMVVRGGVDYSATSEDNPITSTLRGFVPADKRDGAIGFRLVRSD
ncbi:MAG TPA: SUMF1/EgtB/PvdO family nonheme iron enzyme, partial [Pyrinomonadaceae bacterium]|nr:SUMF1/EgtB/PvdO family nonheme iron enzyme [Pyrinomonadaceae bacterium]